MPRTTAATTSGVSQAGDGAARGLSRPLVQVAIVLAVCGVIYWPLLGAPGLAMTEGHRVIPAWEMLDSGDWLTTRLFERPYLRKPPGMSWAIAASSALLGRTEFAARAVSALATTLSCLLVMAAARRWFGARGALGAGLAQALTPLWWAPGRSAEIEPLHNLAIQAALLLLLDVLLRGARRRWVGALGVGAALGVAAIAKGPAGFPCVAGALAGAAVAAESVRILARRELLVALGVPSLVLAGLVVVLFGRAAQPGPPPVVQGVSAFLWSAEHAWGAVTLLPVALATALPGALAILFPWGPDARAESGAAPADRSPVVMARALALATLLSLLLMACLGMGNPRHAMPALTFLSPLVGYVAAGIGGGFTARRALAGRLILLWWPWVWPVALTIGGAGFAIWSAERRERISGRDAGIAIGGALPGGCEVWADGVIDARPEILAYARRRAAESGRTVRARWLPLTPGALPGEGAPATFLLLRHDERVDELGAYRAAGFDRSLAEVGRWQVYKYRVVLLEARPGGPHAGAP